MGKSAQTNKREQQEAMSLLSEFKIMIAVKDYDLGPTSLLLHTINTKNN